MAQWLFVSGRMHHGYVAARGTLLGRNGRVRIERDGDGRVWVGGRTRTLSTGFQPDAGQLKGEILGDPAKSRNSEDRRVRTQEPGSGGKPTG